MRGQGALGELLSLPARSLFLAPLSPRPPLLSSALAAACRHSAPLSRPRVPLSLCPLCPHIPIAPVPPCPHVPVLPCSPIPVSPSLCPCVPVPLCPPVLVALFYSLCPHHVPMPLCRLVSISRCPHLSTLLCPHVPVTPLTPVPSRPPPRLRSLPGAAHAGLRASEERGDAGRCPWRDPAYPLPLRGPGPRHPQHQLPRDRPCHRHHDVREGTACLPLPLPLPPPLPPALRSRVTGPPEHPEVPSRGAAPSNRARPPVPRPSLCSCPHVPTPLCPLVPTRVLIPLGLHVPMHTCSHLHMHPCPCVHMHSCPHTSVSLCPCVPVSPCLHVPCPAVPMPLKSNVPLSPFVQATMSPCSCGPMPSVPKPLCPHGPLILMPSCPRVLAHPPSPWRCWGAGWVSSSTQGCWSWLNACPRVTSQIFRRDAYLADNRQALLRGVEDFLEASIVLPPTETPSEQQLRSLVPLQQELLRRRYQPPERAPRKEFPGVPGMVGTTLVPLGSPIPAAARTPGAHARP